LAAALPTNRIVPTDLERCREGEQGRRQIFGVTEADLELEVVCPLKGAPGMQQIAELVDANDRRSRALRWRVRGKPEIVLADLSQLTQ
jgi:hypothetical protein